MGYGGEGHSNAPPGLPESVALSSGLPLPSIRRRFYCGIMMRATRRVGGLQVGRMRVNKHGMRLVRYESRSSKSLSIMKSFIPLLWPKNRPDLKRRVVISVGLMVGAKLMNIQVPMLFKQLIDELNQVQPHELVMAVPVALVAGYALARMSASLMGELRNAVFAKVSQSAIRRMAIDTFKHIHSLGIDFHLGKQTGGLSRAIDRGTRGISTVMNAMLFHFIPTILEIGLVCSILTSKFGAKYALMTFATIGAYSAFTLGITQWRTKFRKEMNQMENEAGSVAVDSLLNFETVKYYNSLEHEASKYSVFLQRYDEAALKTQASLSLLNFGQSAIFSGALGGMMYMSAKGVAAGDLTLGDIVLVNGLLFQLSIPLNFLGSMYRELRQALIDMENLFEILEKKRDVQDKESAVPLLLEKPAKIHFSNLSFGYNDQWQILKDIDFSVDSGKHTAIVGPSGSGKSTLLRLLFRFYDPKEGSIQIDGKDIRDLTMNSIREHISVIPQDTVLFNESIYYNIHYGNTKASEAEVIEAAKKAQVHGNIMRMPDGYGTMVGERGLKLSGGEKQRVAIARAILKNSPILLCDEATSAVDSSTESEIKAALQEAAGGKTTLTVAHRLTTVMNADEIIVLDEGQIVQRGTHSQLLADRGGIYHRMWHAQTEIHDPTVITYEDKP